MNESNESPARVLLVGNPNVGKSAVFSRLTGAHVIASNYPGTTVEFSEGRMNLGDSMARVIDVPGTYTLEPVSRAEEVAMEMLEHGDIVVNVVDATNLERNLNLTLQLLRTDMPVVVALNMWDEAQEHGVEIDLEELEQQLGVPVVPTCAISGEGIQKLRQRLEDARPGNWDFNDDDKWCRIGEVVDSNLETDIKNLYCCDASVFPSSLGLPVVWTAVSLGKRLAKHIDARMGETAPAA